MNPRLRRRYRFPPWYKFTEEAGLVSADLGKRKVGVAIFDQNAVLVSAKTIHTQPDTREWSPHITVEAITQYVAAIAPDYPLDWVCEYPELRRNDRSNHHNITPLQHVGDLLHGKVGWAEKYRPFEWKRNTPKDQHHRRIREALSEDERIIWDRLGHDAKDAVGIGLFALGRIDYMGREL